MPAIMDPASVSYDEPPEASQWNGNNSYRRVNLEDLKMDSNFAMLLCSLVFAVIWVIYITYYNSRVIGYVITKIMNRFFISEGYFKIGSVSFNALSGKIMFRDVVYITHDYTVRVQDGYLIFRWWRSYVPKDVSEDLSHSDTRLSVVLNGFELHVYNRSEVYANLERIFGIGPNIFPDNNNQENNKVAAENLNHSESQGDNSSVRKQRPEAAMARTWRDLIPVIKIDISSSRLVFGNRLIPTTLSITFEESHFVYSTKPAVCTLDRFMHFVKSKAENVRVMLAPSLKYTGMLDEPPRYMGEGFVLMSTNDLELYFYMDEPGLVPDEPVLITLANGDVVESSPPQWGVDIKCGKGTDFSYGPWADRQREHLFKFFYPQDYRPMEVSKIPKPGEKRQMQSFDVRLLIQSDSTIDILFTKDKETNAVHINVGAGSYLEITLPWITLQDGYTTKINGQLLHCEASTSLIFRDFVVSETLEFCLLCHYPLVWNDHQLWEINLTGCKATVEIIFAHKWFFQDLINDWASKQLPDLMHFVPYTWRFGLTLKHCELITFVNQYNWIDCSSVNSRTRLENTQLALCAHFLHLSFDLPFDEFLPETVPLNFSIQGESVDLSLFIPEFHTSRNTVLSLEKYAKVLSKDGSSTKKTEIIPKWRNVCQTSAGWVDFWWVPIGAINIVYCYHPCPPLGTTPQADISTPVKEEILLSPMRFPHHRKSHRKRSPEGGVQKFDPTTLKADTVSVELEIGPSVLLLYGTALKNFMNFKENIFGEDQVFTDMQQTLSPTSTPSAAATSSTVDNNNPASTSGGTIASNNNAANNPTTGDLKTDDSSSNIPLELREDFDHRTYRPLEVDVSVIMHDIQAHLLKNCTDKDPPCPIILVERFGFEMKKRYDQTELQLLLSPSVLLVSDNLTRPSKDRHLGQGKLTLSSLQVRGHAMFSDVGQSLDQDTVEYAWLIEVQCGKLSGKLTPPQLYSLLVCMETLVLLMTDAENELNSPKDDALLAARPAAPAKKRSTTTTSTGQNVHVQQVQQAIQQLLQPKSSANAANKNTSGGGIASNINQHQQQQQQQNQQQTAQQPQQPQQANSGANAQKNASQQVQDKNKAASRGDGDKKKANNEEDKRGGGSFRSNNLQQQHADENFETYGAHKLKYKLCRVAVDAVDFWLVESGAAMQFWVSPIRLAECNLHGKQVSSGLSCIMYGTSVRQLIWQPHKYNHNKANTDNSDLWLEVGAVNFGPVIVESAISSEAKEQNLHAVQQKFLKVHDERRKKLWFLWPELNKTVGQQQQCGCTGGCTFFGINRNGTRFFKPSKTDLAEGVNVAAFRINEPGKDPGFGQSILHEGMLIFRTPPYIVNEISLQDTLTRKKPQAKASSKIDSPRIGSSAEKEEEVVTFSPSTGTADRKANRRFSSTSMKSSVLKEVPYSRLVDACPPALPTKLDSDSKLHSEVSKLTVNQDQGEPLPKNSISDSKLAVDYFNAPTVANESLQTNATAKPSESHHSLGGRISSDERLQREVQRTTSMSSENQSETFFSADEDVNVNSRSSSLRNSILSAGGTLTRQNSNSVPPQRRKKFSSELSIVADRQYKTIGGVILHAPGSAPEANRLRLSSHRSDHEIHTPEHRSFVTNRQMEESQRIVQGLVTPQRQPHHHHNANNLNSINHSTSSSPRFAPPLLYAGGNTAFASSAISGGGGATTDEQQIINLYNNAANNKSSQDDNSLGEGENDSSADSYSSTSYVSAVGSQEDFTLVDLHMQVNRLIVDSPMLMSSYVAHLSQSKCPNWGQPKNCDRFSTPLFEKSDDGKLVYIGGRFVPCMECTYEGITSLKMVSKSETLGAGASNNKTPTSPFMHPSSSSASAWDQEEAESGDAQATSSGAGGHGSFQEEELLGHNQTDAGCRTTVIVKLKGDLDVMISPLLLESLQRFVDALTPTVANLHPLTVINHLHTSCVGQVENANILKTTENIARLCQTPTEGAGNVADGIYEETVKTQLQAAIYLPKVNVTLLQVSIVEEIISFSALDNIKDLTCVSLFSVCFDNVTAKLHCDKQAREVLQRFHRPSVVQGGSKKGNKAKLLLGFHTNTNADIIQGEPVFIESCEKQQQQLVVCLNVGKAHAQLRRLRNESSILDDAVITAIPNYKSKVLFTPAKAAPQYRGVEYYLQPSVVSDTQTPQIDDATTEDKLGFIMFECGLEGVSLKIVKKSQFEHIECKLNVKDTNRTAEDVTGNVSNKIPEECDQQLTEVNNRPSSSNVTPKLMSHGGNHHEKNTKPSASTTDNATTATPKLVGGEKRETNAGGSTTTTATSHPLAATGGTTAASTNASSESTTAALGGGGTTSSSAGVDANKPGDWENVADAKENPSNNNANAAAILAKDSGNVSSCVIELKVVWFNFAAPPRAPITRKIDYTRLDWNLLSTASPAINAWMNPSNRLAIRVVHMVRTMYRRSTAVIACLMAEALEIQKFHMLAKSRYDKLTPLAQTLQEDPSLQLCSILQKYYMESDANAIENNLRESEIPQLFTLRQGVIVLSRQWKNILYTPLLPQHTVKSKVKPLNVTIAVPEIDEMYVTDGEASGNEDHDITDEHARLLHSGIILKPNAHRSVGRLSKDNSGATQSPHMNNYLDPNMHAPQVAVVSGGVESVLTSPSPTAPHRRRKKSLQPTQHLNSTRASVVLPLLTSSNPFVQKRTVNDDSLCYGTLREDLPIYNMGSDPSEVCSHSSPELVPSSPLHKNANNTHSSEDLYSWMAKQDTTDTETGTGGGATLKGCLESKIDAVDPESSGGEPGGGIGSTMPNNNTGHKDQAHHGAVPGISLYPIQDSVRLLDANQIFQPLLSGLGVMPQQLRFTTMSDSNAGNDVTTLDALGSNFCLVGNMETMHIDIVVSEHGKTEKKKQKKKGKGLFVEVTNESPAFVCDKVAVELEIDRMTDMAVNEMMKTKNVLYISRGQLKNHTSTVINFTIGVRYISQRVNMPLLRLLHQITNMYQNVKDTQNELREQQPVEIRRSKTSASDHADIKHHSSMSDIQETVHSVDPTASTTTTNKQLSLKISDPGSFTSHHTNTHNHHNNHNNNNNNNNNNNSNTNNHSSSKPIVSPSPSIRSRPQSFAQKLRSTGKSVKGYVNLSEGSGGTPLTLSSPSGSALDEHVTVTSSDKSQGRCWKTIYHLLDLYATMPDTKTIKHRFSVGTYDISEHYKGNRKYDILTEMKSNDDLDKLENTPPVPTKSFGTISKEHTKLVVFGVARIHRTRLLATLSGLKLEAEITSLHSSLTCKKSTPAILECSLTGQVGRTMIVLLEGVAPNQQTVVKVTIGKSQALYSTVIKRARDKNSGLLTVGAINIDIPQHPVALHGMVTRGSKQLSSTLQELRVTRTSSRLSRGAQPEEEQQSSPNRQTNNRNNSVPLSSAAAFAKTNTEEKSLLQPLVMQFSVILQSLSITAALLPSLQAQYKMDQVNSTGFTGSKAKFTVDLPRHSLSFTTKIHGYNRDKIEVVNLPSEASIALPAVHVSAEYIPESATGSLHSNQKSTDGVVFRQGGYLSANADIGVFEHSLTTDLLNHLVFVQKVFMKEVNEVVQKVYGGERPVPIWLEDTEESSSLNRLLFSLVIRIQRIQLTATTAGSSAVRLETGAVVLELSNRVQNISGGGASTLSNNPANTAARLFGKAQVDLNLSLGQIIRNALFEEADVEYQPVAFFNTRIGLRNAFQDEIVEGGGGGGEGGEEDTNKEVVLITLKRPLVYIQPVAVDKAILVWLNYKNAYDYWNEKRANLNKEVLTATQQVYEKFQFGQFTSQLSAPHLGTLFLQLTVEDMGICLPLNPLPLTWNQRNVYEESRGAVVVTLENTSISACSSGSLVSKGKFSNLCLRFADDFENSLDDWKPDMTDSSIMNLCVVSDGTYEVCSRTIAAKQPVENAKWFLNVQWQMEGVDIHLDTNVGKQLSALGHTLTMLTGAEEAPFPVDYDSDDNEPTDGTRASQESILPAFMFDPSLDNRSRSKLIEKEMNEQAKIINDLRSLGASHGTIELELKRLHELEAMVYKDFRRDMIQKLRRQSVRAQSIKGKFGLGGSKSAFRSKSFVVPSPMMEGSDSPENDQTAISGTCESYESSPRSGPSRSASLRVRNVDSSGGGGGGGGPRVTFSDNQPMNRQSSLPSASSEMSLPETHHHHQHHHHNQVMDSWVDQLDIDGEKVVLRKKMPPSSYDSIEGANLMDAFMNDPDQGYTSSPYQSSSGNMTQSSLSQKPQEPNIDLELDVKVFINSGKCVLHTKDPVKEEEIKLNRMRKDRSCSAGLLEFPPSAGSPDPGRRNKDKHLGQTSASRIRNTPHVTLVDLTIFHIPGMDVKLHYQSKVIPDEPLLHSTQQSPESDRAFYQQYHNNKSPYSAAAASTTTTTYINETYNNVNNTKPGTSGTTTTTAVPAKKLSFDETEETRIEKAFKRQESTQPIATTSKRVTTTGSAAGSSASDLKSSSSIHGITNPNYGCSPASSKTSLNDLQFGGATTGETVGHNSVTPPHDGRQQQQQQQHQRFMGNWSSSSGGGGGGGSFSAAAGRRGGIKKASLFAWMTLQSVPEETIISPHILEFLEQTLEPIPAKTNFNTTDTSFLSSDQDSTNYGNYVYASFPVDVIVYFHMQPSTFRFSCLPVSRVECMLQLPSLDIVFSSKRAEDDLFNSEFGDGAPNTAATAVGGLSVTGCLSDFSVYIFHPYGGKKSALKEAQWSPLSDSERKDSLSINVEFVKFHLSRSRMLNFKQESLANRKGGDQSRAVIRFSTIIDIGSASFKYDMRRLTEILAFPKAWYRRSIVRRMFLGDLSMSAVYNEEEDVGASQGSPSTMKNHESRKNNEKSPLLSTKDRLKLSLDSDAAAPRHSQKLKDLGRAFSNDSTTKDDTTPSPSDYKNLTAWETLVVFAVNFKKLNVHMNMGNVMGNVSWLTKDFRSDGRLSIGSTGHKNLYIALGLGGSGLDAKGGIVGGNIEIANIDTFVHIREEPEVEPDHTVGVKLHALELRLDYMATSVLMCRVSDLNVNLRDEWRLNRTSSRDSIPTRRPASIFMHGDLSWDQLQMMISKSTTADLLKMFNKLEEFFSQQFNSSKRAFSGFAGSTRPSGRVPVVQKNRESATAMAGAAATAPSNATTTDARHHRHWQKTMSQVAGRYNSMPKLNMSSQLLALTTHHVKIFKQEGLQLGTMDMPLPQHGTVLGGTMELHGNNISLACFHGINFKSKSWALFSLKEPCITFNTEGQEIPSTSESPPAHDVHVVQTLTCSLGLSTYKTHLSMATVCKVSRSVIFPPQFKTLQEWFHYAFANSQIDEVDRFPSLEREKTTNEGNNSMERNQQRSSNSPKLADPNHNREVIFAVPSLQLHLKTEHLQTARVPDLAATEDKPTVECSFITEFEDHIFVTVDAEAFFFLHDLITSYVKEKERLIGSSEKRSSVDFQQDKVKLGDTSGPSKKGSIDVDIFAKDWRNYNCKTWHLEPTVRLLSVAGKYIEPYGIDYILQKLGFSHARTTIPKWMQRGFMDPLDAILAVLTLRMVQVVKGDGNKTNNSEKDKAVVIIEGKK